MSFLLNQMAKNLERDCECIRLKKLGVYNPYGYDRREYRNGPGAGGNLSED